MKPELSEEEQSKDRYFSQIAKITEEMMDAHGKDFAMGAFVLAARWIAEGKFDKTGENMH